MCSQLKNVVIFALLISSWDVDAIKQRRRNISKRQLGNGGPVVQPGYSANQPINTLDDEEIIVTKKALDETEHIRHDINEAVEEDIYVVELNDNDFKEIENIQNEVKVVDEIKVIKTKTKTIEKRKKNFKKYELKNEKWFLEYLKINEGLFRKLVKNIETIFKKFIPLKKLVKTN